MTAINQTITFNTTADKLYDALISSSVFAEFTGAPAQISTEEGGTFSCFGGQIIGRHIELLSNQRIVQAWRAAPWQESVYSIVRFDIEQTGETSTLVLEHSGFPTEGADHLDGGWHKMYWEPLRAHFS